LGVRRRAVHTVALIAAAAPSRKRLVRLIRHRKRAVRRQHRTIRSHRQTQRKAADDDVPQYLKCCNHEFLFNHTSASRDSSSLCIFGASDVFRNSPPYSPFFSRFETVTPVRGYTAWDSAEMLTGKYFIAAAISVAPQATAGCLLGCVSRAFGQRDEL
jgi:hypothetical protein